MLLHWRAMFGLGLGIGLGWMGLSQPAWSASTGSDPVNPLRLTVAEAVLGILAHTRWPQRTAGPLTLCVHERSTSAPELRTLHESVPTGRLSAVRMVDLADTVPVECDVAFLGGGPAAAAPLPLLTGRPVLHIGEGADFCSRGGMFCLVPRTIGIGATLRVEVNLDAVARSGLHVHPQVLKIGQPRTGVAP